MKKFIFVLSALSLVLGCSSKTQLTFNELAPSASVIGGVPVTADNVLAKSTVGLLINYDLGNGKVWVQGCTGSVLNKRFILTAAHCIFRTPAKDVVINFSLKGIDNDKQLDPATRVTDIEKHFVVRKAKAMMSHPQYTGAGGYDLALIMLEEEVPADAIPVTLLPDSFLNKAEGKTTLDGQKFSVVLMGFGLIKEVPMTGTDVLRVATTPAHFEGLFVVTDQTQGTGGCNGDSGGPAYLDIEGIFYQVGVTHGPHGNSTTCHEQGEWMNPALDNDFIKNAQAELSKSAVSVN